MKRNRLIVLALMLIGLMNAQKVCAQGSTQKWAGHTPAEVAKATAGEDDALFYLYNVGTGLYLSQGGIWGTCAVVSEAGIQFQRIESTSNVTGAYNLKTFVGSDANSNYMNFSNGTNLESPGYFFLDKLKTLASQDFRYTSSFVFTNVSGDGEQNIYTIYATSKQGGSDYKGTFYLSVNDDNTCYGKQRTDADDKAVATTITDNDKWIIVTKADFIANFSKTNGTEANPAYAPHLVYDAGFYREDTNVKNWAMGKDGTTFFNEANYCFYTMKEDGSLKETNTRDDASYADGFTPKDAIPSTKEVTKPATYTYTVVCTYSRYGVSDSHTTKGVVLETDYGETKTLENNFISFDLDPAHTVYVPYVGTVNANLTKQVLTKTGSTHETTQTETSGGYTYYIGNGYNMAKKAYDANFTFEDGSSVEQGGTYYQKLFGGYWTANIHGTEGSISQQITPKRIGWWKVSAKGFSNDGTGNLFAYAGGTDQKDTDKFQVQPFNKVDTAAVDVKTYVKASKYLNTTESQSVTVYVGAVDETLTFGAYIKKGEGKANSWTCFDDFTLSYLGEGELNLIIDETNEEIANINGQSNTKDNQTLRLTRSFKTDKWNSLVLPVKLTAQQVKTAFGADTKLSALHHTELKGKRIFFEKVDLSVADADAIEAGKLYIIKPQNAMPTGQDEKTRKLNGENARTITSQKSYYTINQVSLIKSDLQADVEDIGFVESIVDHGIKMVGTYVQKKPAEGHSIPANSYILSDGTWYYHTKGVKNVKGLRGWIQTNAGPSETKFFINGVEEGEVTAIEGIESSMEVSKRINSNIYNLNGQLVRSNSVSAEGLDKGIYIIGGKKVVVK